MLSKWTWSIDSVHDIPLLHYSASMQTSGIQISASPLTDASLPLTHSQQVEMISHDEKKHMLTFFIYDDHSSFSRDHKVIHIEYAALRDVRE